MKTTNRLLVILIIFNLVNLLLGTNKAYREIKEMEIAADSTIEYLKLETDRQVEEFVFDMRLELAKIITVAGEGLVKEMQTELVEIEVERRLRKHQMLYFYDPSGEYKPIGTIDNWR